MNNDLLNNYSSWYIILIYCNFVFCFSRFYSSQYKQVTNLNSLKIPKQISIHLLCLCLLILNVVLNQWSSCEKSFHESSTSWTFFNQNVNPTTFCTYLNIPEEHISPSQVSLLLLVIISWCRHCYSSTTTIKNITGLSVTGLWFLLKIPWNTKTWK